MMHASRTLALALVGIALLSLSACQTTAPQADPAQGIWFAKAGGSGDGTSEEAPTGSLAEISTRSQPGDTIIILASEDALDGAIVLKQGQTLTGRDTDEDEATSPVLTNTDRALNGGVAVQLASQTRVSRLVVEDASASALLGIDVSMVEINEVVIISPNSSGAILDGIRGPLAQPITHGGVVFVSSASGEGATNNSVSETVVTGARGAGLLLFAQTGANATLSVAETVIADASDEVGIWDIGIGLIGSGADTSGMLNIAETVVNGQSTFNARGVIIFADAGSSVSANIAESVIMEAAQDGVIAVASGTGSSAQLAIAESVLSGAGQSNLEGTVINVPASSEPDAIPTVRIAVADSILSRARGSGPFEGAGNNILLTGSKLTPAPITAGIYELQISGSQLDEAQMYDIAVGGASANDPAASSASRYNVSIEGTVMASRSGAVRVAAEGTQIWGSDSCLEGSRETLPYVLSYSCGAE